MGADNNPGGADGERLLSESIPFQEPKPKLVYIPKPGENIYRNVMHEGNSHSAAMAYIAYGKGGRPAHNIIQSHVKAVLERMRENGYVRSPICLVEGDIWADTPMTRSHKKNKRMS